METEDVKEQQELEGGEHNAKIKRHFALEQRRDSQIMCSTERREPFRKAQNKKTSRHEKNEEIKT